MSDTRAMPPLPGPIHFIGIGGIGMSGLAMLAHEAGYLVTGSDAREGDQLRDLRSAGIPVTVGHSGTATAGNAAMVVISAAVPEGNPEILAARANAVPIVKRAELLGMLANGRTELAVAGSHGKSTTSGMLVSALHKMGVQPSYAVGAVIGTTGRNAGSGDAPEMVVEADEYDRSFHWLKPQVAIITNVDYDHPDIYPTVDAYEESFAQFLRGVSPDGAAVVAVDDPGTANVLARIGVDRDFRLVTFGETADATWQLYPSGDSWRVKGPGGTDVALRLAVPGRHNVRNATAALAALEAAGYPAAEVASALSAYTGVGRRFEFKGEVAGVMVIDDYAHHPAEIRATLLAARSRFPNRRIVAVFQPHTYSRTFALTDEFAASLDQADLVMLLDIYAARETDTLGVSIQDIGNKISGPVTYASDPADAAVQLADLVEPGDVVLTLGAGDVTESGPSLIEQLKASV